MASVICALLLSFQLCTAQRLSLGAQSVNLWKLSRHSSTEFAGLGNQNDQVPFSGKKPKEEFEEQWFTQPLDHFSNDTIETFGQRYWVSTRHYTQGMKGPVIVLDGGETSGENRLPFLDTGIVDILARATGGVGVILEHRYYGKSIPVQNLSTDSLRWLNNAQSAEDSANFMRNVKFEMIDEDLTAPGTPWIYYGGSYAGARAAHMKILYPDIVYGAIASSAVTHASIDDWEYFDVIRQAADTECSEHLQNSITTIDGMLAHPNLGMRRMIKTLFGLQELKHDDDFGSLLTSPLSGWQAKNWDPTLGSTMFDDFCADLTKPPFGYEHLLALPYEHQDRLVAVGDGMMLDFAVLNYANYIKEHIVSLCPDELGIESCFGTYDDEQYHGVTLDQDWRLWLFQVCTEWGYFKPSPPDPSYPRIVSNLITLSYESKICRQAFPPGKHFTVPSEPNVTVVNELGSFDIAADRLAIIDAEVDPWRPMTPHSTYFANDREDTILRPFKLIPNGVHHYDEFGLRKMEDEPPEIRKIHGEMILFVMEWLKDWNVTDPILSN